MLYEVYHEVRLQLEMFACSLIGGNINWKSENSKLNERLLSSSLRRSQQWPINPKTLIS